MVLLQTQRIFSRFAGFSVQFETRMRAAPTVTIYGTSGTSGKMNADSSEGTAQASYIGEKTFCTSSKRQYLIQVLMYT